jgi:arylsulfatase A-like enzyme
MNSPAIQDKRQRVLIVIFDALRPEFVTPELMPNLHGFAQNGVCYVNSHSTYPTETRVNQSAVITGCYPSRHGIVANKFVLNEGGPAQLLNSGDDIQLESAFKQLDGRLLDVPTLGERLTAAGRSYATLSAGTPGGGRLINHAAEINGTFRFAMRRPEAAMPAGVLDAITSRVGPLPEYTLPALDWISYAVNCYLEYVETDIDPDVMLLWLCEPDESFHKLGIGSEDALRAIRHVDTEFGRILARHEKQISSGELQIIALSDHGQISLQGQRLNLAAKLTEAGFETGTGENPDCRIAVANAGGIWVRESDSKLVSSIIHWLRAQDWCGPLFTRDGAEGTLTHEDIALAHRRAPDIALVLRHTDEANEWGINGMSQHDAIYPTGGGCHGGLSRYELHNFLALSGSRFLQGETIDIPAGNVDISPTVLDILGLEIPKDIDGRVLGEAYRNGFADTTMLEVQEQTLSSSNSEGPRTHLSVSRVGTTRYFNKAWVE